MSRSSDSSVALSGKFDSRGRGKCKNDLTRRYLTRHFKGNTAIGQYFHGLCYSHAVNIAWEGAFPGGAPVTSTASVGKSELGYAT